MVQIERSPGQAVRIGQYTLWVVSINADEVVIALLDPDKDCACCGEWPADPYHCPVCQARAVVCPDCVRSWKCPQCASRLV